MDYSTRLRNDLKAQRKRQIRLEARTEKEFEKFCTKYHRWVEDERNANRAPLTILAEGDSWFRYPVGFGVIYQLEKLLDLEILNLASAGDESGDMLSIRQKKRLVRELKSGPARRMKYDYLLFSAGGNDLVGADRFHKWLHPYVPGMKASDVINSRALGIAFAMLELNYNELIEIRDTHSPSTKLVFHSYDLAIPDGRGVCGRGPWMKPGLDLRNIPDKLRREVVALFLKEFDQTLRAIAQSHANIIVIETQGTLVDSEWANELHPRNVGFKKIAQQFALSL